MTGGCPAMSWKYRVIALTDQGASYLFRYRWTTVTGVSSPNNLGLAFVLTNASPSSRSTMPTGGNAPQYYNNDVGPAVSQGSVRD